MSTIIGLSFTHAKPWLLIVCLSLAATFGSVNAAAIIVPDNYITIQAAIDAASNGDTIIVRPGTYVENINFNGKAITLKSEQGPDVTIIDGNLNGSVVCFVNNEGLDSVLDGFTISNGSGTYSTDYPGYYEGGGVLCDGASPTIINNSIIDNNPGGPGRWTQGGGVACIRGASPLISCNMITSNTAYRGGAIYVRSVGSSPVISRNELRDNIAFSGGAIDVWEGYPTVEHNRITSNHANYVGGGIELNDTADGAVIQANIIANNAASFQGGGVFCWKYTRAVIVDNIIVDNSSITVPGFAQGGGICVMMFADVVIANCTIVGNKAARGGGGISCVDGSKSVIANTVLWDNSAPVGTEIWIEYSSTTPGSLVDIQYSVVEGGQASIEVETGSTLIWGSGMIESDPLFAELSERDFHLTFQSPCKNSGLNHPLLSDKDFEGDPRIAGGRVDIGADEYYFHLYHIGSVIPGSTSDFRIVGGPGMPVLLGHSHSVQDPPLPTSWGDLYLTVPLRWRSNIGTIPSSGILSFPITVPSFWSPGDEKYFQAMVGAPGGPMSTLTNLGTLEVE